MPMGLKSLLVVVGGWLKSNIVSNPVPLRDLEKPKEARWVGTGKGWVRDS